MTAIITEKFRLHNASQFVESFSEAANSTYYLFIGKSMPFTSGTTGGTDTPPTPADSVSNEFYSWDSMLAAKKIASTDVTNALPRHNWTNKSTIYDRYDDTVSASNTTATGASSLYQTSFIL